MTYFIRTEDGIAANVTTEVGLAEANRCMMDGKREVAEMTAVSGLYMIWYKDGRKVTLSRQDGDMPAPAKGEQDAPADEPPDAWTVASHRMLLHRFTAADESGRAVCNRRFRPWRYGNGYAFRTKAEQLAHEYADLYTFCPRCEAKESRV